MSEIPPPITQTQPTDSTSFSQSEMMRFESQKKSVGLAFALCWFLGIWGAHRFYMKKPHAVTKLVCTIISIPLCFLLVGFLWIIANVIWTFIDLFYISGWVKEYNTTLLTKIQSEKS
jgi:TM2 domain-containing membrane protein YozV